MKRWLLLIFTFLLSVQTSFALEVIYPKTTPVKINSKSTFFIGSADPSKTLTVNDIPVQVSSIGAFAHCVNLYEGLNIFLIKSGEDSLRYAIFTEKPPSEKNAEVVDFPKISTEIAVNNSILRSTPIDGGLNRLAQLPVGTKILINGEKAKFYRVYLNSQESGWVLKSDVATYKSEPKSLALCTKVTNKTSGNFSIYEFQLTHKVPFSIKENNGINLKFYNVETPDDNTYYFNLSRQNLCGYSYSYVNNTFVLKVRNNINVKKKVN